MLIWLDNGLRHCWPACPSQTDRIERKTYRALTASRSCSLATGATVLLDDVCGGTVQGLLFRFERLEEDGAREKRGKAGDRLPFEVDGVQGAPDGVATEDLPQVADVLRHDVELRLFRRQVDCPFYEPVDEALFLAALVELDRGFAADPHYLPFDVLGVAVVAQVR